MNISCATMKLKRSLEGMELVGSRVPVVPAPPCDGFGVSVLFNFVILDAKLDEGLASWIYVHECENAAAR
jgi:hypothetical protein